MTLDQFIAAVAAAGEALESLATKASRLKTVATNVQDVQTAEIALKFATSGGPRSLQRAKDTLDSAHLINLQNSIKGITATTGELLKSDAVKRFTLMAIGLFLGGPIGAAGAALVSPEKLEEIKEKVANIKTPPPPQDLPWPLFAGGGAALGLLFGVQGGKWGMLAGAIAGTIAGLAARAGLDQISKKLTI